MQEGDEMLAPAYHHGSEVEAIVRAGLVPRFYEATADLEPDAAELEGLLSARTRALHLVHYLGLPRDAARWRRWCDERGLALVEDAAQAWLATIDGRPVGSWGDLSIFSLYKSDGLPDGGAVIGPDGLAVPPWGGWGLRPVARKVGAFLVARSAVLGGRLAPRRRAAYDPGRDFALGAIAGPTRATTWALRRVPGPGVATARRRNYAHLLDALGERVPAPFDRLPAGASPFAFPVHAADKAELLERLERNGVRGTDLWSVPHPALDAARFPGAAARRATTVILPVHQHLRPADLERIVAAVTGG
jgi:dTDP-4-amino-4,6-dideoxygalactose transaminase